MGPKMVQCLLNHIEPIGLAHIHRALGNFHISRNLEIATFLGWWAHQPTIFGGLVVRSLFLAVALVVSPSSTAAGLHFVVVAAAGELWKGNGGPLARNLPRYKLAT